MASVVVVQDIGHFGDHANARLVEVTMSNSYTTGGETVTPNSCRLGKIAAVLPAAAAGYVPVWDQANSKLLAYRVGAENAALAQVSNATNLSSVKFTALVIGTP
jgi:hypothetical protein